MPTNESGYDVVVVGGGKAGLAEARETVLAQRAQPWEIAPGRALLELGVDAKIRLQFFGISNHVVNPHAGIAVRAPLSIQP